MANLAKSGKALTIPVPFVDFGAIQAETLGDLCDALSREARVFEVLRLENGFLLVGQTSSLLLGLFQRGCFWLLS